MIQKGIQVAVLVEHLRTEVVIHFFGTDVNLSSIFVHDFVVDDRNDLAAGVS